MEVWFGSDFHFDHENIVRGVSKWEDTRACRPFDTLEEHNEILIQNINNSVKKDDVLFFDGDWAFNGRSSIYDFRKRLNCKTIHFILGNHDHHIRKNAIVNDELNIKAHSLFTSVNDILYKTIFS